VIRRLDKAVAGAEAAKDNSYCSEDEFHRLLRGGAFNTDTVIARSAYRALPGPANPAVNFGFRPARTYP
jgi:hypothetical protein